MIYTSYFAKLNKLPADVVPISICGKAPSWYNGIQFKKLAPKYGFFMEWKQNHDNEYYIQHFSDEVLSQLNASDVVSTLLQLSNGKDVALICYEKPGDFCHRHLVCDWLNDNGFSCKEWDDKDLIKT